MPVWLLITAAVVGMLGTVIGLHFSILKAVDRRIEETTEAAVHVKVDPVILALATITAKLDNGVLAATRKHSDQIAELAVQVGNLSGQIERVLVTK